jgi:hypothetical protein
MKELGRRRWMIRKNVNRKHSKLNDSNFSDKILYKKPCKKIRTKDTVVLLEDDRNCATPEHVKPS